MGSRALSVHLRTGHVSVTAAKGELLHEVLRRRHCFHGYVLYKYHTWKLEGVQSNTGVKLNHVYYLAPPAEIFGAPINF